MTNNKIKQTSKGNNSPNITAGGNVIIGYSIEEHETKLKKRVVEVRKELKEKFDSETIILSQSNRLLEYELMQIKSSLANSANLEVSYQEKVQSLESTIKELSMFSSEVDDSSLVEAQAELVRGESGKAELLFAQIEEKYGKAIESSAKAAFQRGKIAKNNLNYSVAFEHFKRVIGYSTNNSEYLEEAASVAGILGKFQDEIKWNEEALVLHQRVRSDIGIARVQNNLGRAWCQLGGFEKAIEYHELTLARDLRILEKDHPRIATYRCNLGSAWQALGQYKKAFEYYEQALASDLKTLGKDHPDVARDLNNLGGGWHCFGEFEKAIEYYELALACDLKNYGAEHPNISIRHNNLGCAWLSLGFPKKAIKYHTLSLASNIKLYGEDHPDVALNHNNLAQDWQHLGRYKKAISYYELALYSDLKNFGLDHPNVATDHHNLGSAWQALGQYKKAITYFELALSSLKRKFPNGHQLIDIATKSLKTCKVALMKEENDGKNDIEE